MSPYNPVPIVCFGIGYQLPVATEPVLVYLTGFFCSVVVGHFCVQWLSKQLWAGLVSPRRHPGLHDHVEHPQMVGLLERFLYTLLFLLGHAEFIGAWLVLKVAGRWKVWAEDLRHNGTVIPARGVFNIFLIGNGYSVAFGIAGALLIRKPALGMAVALAAVAGSIFFGFWEKASRKVADPKS